MAPRTSDRSPEGRHTGGEHSLGEWIRTVRRAQEVSQRALASRAGISRSYLCDIEHGRGSRPSVPVLDKLATALGASRWDLLRAAGILEPLSGPVDNSAERRLLSLYRDLTEGGRSAVEQFARFVNAEEQRWVQPRLVDGDETVVTPPIRQSGPTLFDGLLEEGLTIARGGQPQERARASDRRQRTGRIGE